MRRLRGYSRGARVTIYRVAKDGQMHRLPAGWLGQVRGDSNAGLNQFLDSGGGLRKQVPLGPIEIDFDDLFDTVGADYRWHTYETAFDAILPFEIN